MFPNGLLIFVCACYAGLLCAFAFMGYRYKHKLTSFHQRLIYTLSIGVYCTSWGFLGTAGQASENAYSFLPVYIAPFLLILFGWPFIQKIIAISLKLNVTSIADLLANRFGKSRNLAILVTLMVLVGTMPYMALQIKAIVSSYTLLRQDTILPVGLIGFIVTIILAAFSITFGVRNIDINERHIGLIIAIAFESLLKLFAFLLIGLFVSFYLYDSPIQLWQLAEQNQPSSTDFESLNFLGLMLITFSAFLCLPRQFQTMIVEVRDIKTTRYARWLFPLYILMFALFAIPLGQAGKLLFSDSLSSDAYVLFLPALLGHDWLSLFGFLGSISAASAMVIITSIAISTMLSNEIIFPSLFTRKGLKETNVSQFKDTFLRVRKLIVIAIFGLTFWMFCIAPPDTLSVLGEVSFGAIAQIGPAFYATFFWRRGNLNGALYGMATGFSIWLILNFLPALGVYQHAFTELAYNQTTIATLVALSANIMVMIALSYFTRHSIQEQIQLDHFFASPVESSNNESQIKKVDLSELLALINQFVGDEKRKQSELEFQILASQIKEKQKLNQAYIELTETLLASVMGSSSAKLVLTLMLQDRHLNFSEVAEYVQQASDQQQQFSQNVLQAAIDNANDGISVINKRLELVAWNKAYVDLFNYPNELLYIGSPVSELVRYNLLHQSEIPASEVDKQVEKRLNFIKQGSMHNTERTLNNGKTIRIRGNVIPGGGFVMSFTDVTLYREAEALLREEKQDLQSRIIARTGELEASNQALAQSNTELAKANEKIHHSHLQKSQFLKACSHDLLQPIAAAKLFCASLHNQQNLSSTQQQTIEHIDASLEHANDLIKDLNEVTLIESGGIIPEKAPFAIQTLFDELFTEFELLCQQANIYFRIVPSQLWINSDKKLLRRILQNFLSNACRYAPHSRLLLGCRHQSNQVSIQVIDTGSGIPSDKQELIFQQFTQLKTNTTSSKGLGLGLNIARNLAHLLQHPLTLASEVGKGANFSILVPRAIEQLDSTPIFSPAMNLAGLHVLCVDNEIELTNGMSELLKSWGCKVYVANTPKQALSQVETHRDFIDIMLVDYQLESNINGIELMSKIQQQAQIPGVLITATLDKDLDALARTHGFGFLTKALRPLQLQTMINTMITQRLAKAYAEIDRY
ncbi:response regulator [Parashewanella curva]|uniref:histidine kinase n=1 Tax=Parashewanella curva TaxID=2338552 RepID=A0A3L8PT65_9GAMM|nr:PAS domain-containing hybrid sensor histidine kinase/response regulator [Parashewanella curva]RLV58585.1 response regulator [Parashewanella curva]